MLKRIQFGAIAKLTTMLDLGVILDDKSCSPPLSDIINYQERNGSIGPSDMRRVILKNLNPGKLITAKEI